MHYSLEAVAQEIHKDRLYQAERKRTLKQAKVLRPGPQEKVLIGLSDVLIATGLKLKGQYQSQQPGLRLT